MQATDRITLVLKPQEGETLEQILPFVQLGAPVSIGRGLAVIAGASDEDLQMVLGKERDERAMDIERLESALEIDKHLALAAPEMANLLKRIDVKVGGLMAVAGHGMAPSEEMWDEAESVLAEIELLLNLSQGKPYAPSNLLDEAPLEKFNDFEKKDSTPALSLMSPDSMHIDDRVKMVGSEPAFLTVVFELPSLNDAHPLIALLPYGQKALGTEAVVFGLTTGNLMEGAPCAD